MIVLSLTGVTLFNAIAYYALNYTEALNGLLVQSAAPLLIGFFSFVFFRDSLTRAQIAGIAMSLCGVIVIISRGDPAALLALRFNRGDLWYLGGVVVYSIYAALLRLRPQIHVLSFLAFTIIAGAILQLPATAVEWQLGHRLDPSLTAFVVMAYIVVFPSILGYLFFNRGVDLVGANRAGPFFHLIPVFGSAMAIAFLGETPAAYHGVGYALIIAGIAVAQRRARPASPAG
jgi:drug/metabolite transporter (DMT)-like permease